MNNMRIDIIRNEIDRRYKEIEQIHDKTSPGLLLEPIYRFIHCMLVEPSLRQFIINLSQSHEIFKKTDKYAVIKKQIIDNLNLIASTLTKPDFIDESFKRMLLAEKFDKILSLGNGVVDVNYSLCDFVNDLKNIESKFDSILPELARICGTINTIVLRGKESSRPCEYEQIETKYDAVLKLLTELNAFMKLQAQYDGADSLNKVLPFYLKSSYRYLSQLSENDFGEYMIAFVSKATIGGQETGPKIVDECKNIYHAADRFLSTNQSKSYLIDRLITYCTWIKRNDIYQVSQQKTGKKIQSIEEKISAILQEFIFNQGYFPIVNFKIGRNIPDILIDPVSSNARWDNSILIELKQATGGKAYSEKNLIRDIGQAGDYLAHVKGVKPDIADSVYLLVFYDGKKRLPDNSWKALSSIPDNVQVRFIYVGSETPSKLK